MGKTKGPNPPKAKKPIKKPKKKIIMASRSNTVSRGIPGAGIFGGDQERNATNGTTIECRENAEQAAGIIFLVAGLGIGANVLIMFLILSRRSLRR